MKFFYNLRKTAARKTRHVRENLHLIQKRKFNTWNGWISPHKTRNFLLDDLLTDVLLHTEGHGQVLGGQTKYFLFDQGHAFEAKVVSLLKEKFNENVVDLKGDGLARSYMIADQTIEEMKKGTPILVSPVFHDFEKKVCGVPDLIVRSDWLSKIFVNPPPIENEGCLFSKDWYYTIVDIKFSTLSLRSNSVELLNEDNFKAYKGQLYLYNDYLARVQKYNSQKAYILGRNYKYSNSAEGFISGNGCFDKAGVIDYSGWDNNYHKKIKQCVNWLRKVKDIPRDFTVEQIYKHKLFPNLKVYNPRAQQKKIEIAKQISEITMLPYCGVKNREIALQNGIKGWNDKNCNSQTLGFRQGSHKARIVDSCLKVNRDGYPFTFNQTKLYPSIEHYKRVTNPMFIDFETISSICDDFSTLPRPSNMDLAFMVTVGWLNKFNNFETKTFTAEGLTNEYEQQMIQELIDFLNSRQFTNLVHWGHCDRTTFNKIVKRYNIVQNFDFFDLHRAVENNALGIKGCFNYTLKNVTNALCNMGFVTQQFVKGETGLEAMHRAYIAHQESQGEVFMNHPYIRELKEYNIKDVVALYEVGNFLKMKLHN